VPKYRLEVSNEAAVKEVEEAKAMIALFETMRLVLEAVPDAVMAVVEAKGNVEEIEVEVEMKYEDLT